MTTLTPEVCEKVIKARDLISEAIKEARPKCDGNLDFTTQEDHLRFYLFMSHMEDAVKGTRLLAHVCEVTDEDLRQMCAESDITISTAIQNARMHLVYDVIGSMFRDTSDRH